MARTVSLNKRFNRGVPARAYIKHLHVYTEGEITEKEYLNAFCREIIPVHPEFRLSIKPSKGKSSPRKILDAMRRDAKLFGDKRKLFKSTLNNCLHSNLACVIDKMARGAKLNRAFEELPKDPTKFGC